MYGIGGSEICIRERTDVAEREVWVSTFRDGEATIGVVIKQTVDRRGAHWDPPAGRDAAVLYPHLPRPTIRKL